MSEDTKPASSGDEVVAAEAVVVDSSGNVQAAGIVAADTDHALLVAEFADPNAALETYQALIEAETAGQITVDGVLVVRADANGQIVIQKVTDHSTKTGLKWGIVGGVVLGVLFPPSIIASAAALGVTGGVLGKLRQEHHKSELGAALTGSLAPEHVGHPRARHAAGRAGGQGDHAQGDQGHRGSRGHRDRRGHHGGFQDGRRLRETDTPAHPTSTVAVRRSAWTRRFPDPWDSVSRKPSLRPQPMA